MTKRHDHRKGQPGKVALQFTPETADWRFLSFAVYRLSPGETFTARYDDQEAAIVPLAGSGDVTAGDQHVTLSRTSVFEQMPHVVYAPPRTDMTVVAGPSGLEFSIGSAPAEGRYPARVFAPSEMKRELRGGGTSYRQVHHILAMPLPAERLIMYEVYVPRGTWAGWAPHNHDGLDGSPYLEEVYYFKMNPSEGFLMHRNWREPSPDEEPYDDQFAVYDGDCILVPKGYHSTVACPTSHMYFLNYLAGELVDEERVTPPCFHSQYTWITEDWSKGAWTLPIMTDEPTA